MTNLTKEEYARLHLKAKRGMLTAEERAALEAYEAAAQPAPQTPVPADTETLLCCPYCGHATITTQIVSDVTYRKPVTVIAMMFAPLIAVVLAFLLRNMNEAIEAENIRAALCEDEHTIKAYFEKFLHADFDNPETRDQVLEYFVDKIYLTDDGLVVTSWYSEDRTEVTWDMLYGEDGNPFVKGEAVKFDCFPFGSTRWTLHEHLFFKGGFAVRVWL